MSSCNTPYRPDPPPDTTAQELAAAHRKIARLEHHRSLGTFAMVFGTLTGILAVSTAVGFIVASCVDTLFSWGFGHEQSKHVWIACQLFAVFIMSGVAMAIVHEASKARHSS